MRKRERLVQVTDWFSDIDSLDFAVKQLKANKITPIVKKKKGLVSIWREVTEELEQMFLTAYRYRIYEKVQNRD